MAQYITHNSKQFNDLLSALSGTGGGSSSAIQDIVSAIDDTNDLLKTSGGGTSTNVDLSSMNVTIEDSNSMAYTLSSGGVTTSFLGGSAIGLTMVHPTPISADIDTITFDYELTGNYYTPENALRYPTVGVSTQYIPNTILLADSAYLNKKIVIPYSETSGHYELDISDITSPVYLYYLATGDTTSLSNVQIKSSQGGTDISISEILNGIKDDLNSLNILMSSSYGGSPEGLADILNKINDSILGLYQPTINLEPVLLANGSGVSNIAVPDWNKYRYLIVEYKPRANTDGQVWKSILVPDNNLKGGDTVYYSSTYYWNFTFAIANGELVISNDWTTGLYGSTQLNRTSFDVYVYGVLNKE